jgi:hypothetical protein
VSCIIIPQAKRKPFREPEALIVKVVNGVVVERAVKNGGGGGGESSFFLKQAQSVDSIS